MNRSGRNASTLGKILLSLVVAIGIGNCAFGQGQIALGTITSSGSGPYSYSLSFSDDPHATSPVGSVWYAWVPGAFYLPGSPLSASVPPGWTANISGHSIQYVANAPADYIMPGQTLSGFGYQANFSPAQLAAAPNSGVSVAYSAGLFSDSGYTFTVQAVPEPSPVMFFAVGAAVWLVTRKKLLTSGQPVA